MDIDQTQKAFYKKFDIESGDESGEDIWDWIIENCTFKAIPIEPPVMQWRTRDEKPLPSKRIIIFSPCYPEESDMRKRIITGQFLGLCTEATHWSYISEPSA